MRKIVYGIIALFLVGLLICGIWYARNNDNNGLNLKNDLSEYERLNGDYSSFNTYDTFYDFDKQVLESGTHYVYFGKPNCPWCKEYIYYYDLIAKEKDIKIDYFNLENIKGEQKETESGINTYGVEYQKIYDMISEFDPQNSYNLTTTSLGVYGIYVPVVLKIEDGVILDFVGEVENHTMGENGLRELTEAEQESFKNDLRNLFD